jgi:hypothetical protein
VVLADLPPNSEYFFSIKQPDARFKSAFYSRKRKGQPRLYVEWSRHEREMFSIFEHANDLAEALFENSPKGYFAFCAMKTSIHFTAQYDWFERNGFFLKLHPPVAILRQEYLSEDVTAMISKLELKKSISVTEDHMLSYQNNYEGIPNLSGKARKNLRVCPRIESQVDCWALEALLANVGASKRAKIVPFSIFVANQRAAFGFFRLRNVNSWTDC